MTTIILMDSVLFGLQYSMGVKRNEPQIYNLSDPVEYNIEEQAALQGTKSNTMKNISSELGVFFGATCNFMTGKNKDKERDPQ